MPLEVTELVDEVVPKLLLDEDAVGVTVGNLELELVPVKDAVGETVPVRLGVTARGDALG
jgi:hypothetical protein